jgi:hypothetical protein
MPAPAAPRTFGGFIEEVLGDRLDFVRDMP